MANAREEFERHVNWVRKKVYCAEINKDYEWDMKTGEGYYAYSYKLYVGYTDEDYSEFLKTLNFSYEDGYGTQKLFGIIWFEDMTWSTRGEYDGKEWWEHHRCPEIPFELWKRQNGKIKDDTRSNTGDSRLHPSKEGGKADIPADRV